MVLDRSGTKPSGVVVLFSLRRVLRATPRLRICVVVSLCFPSCVALMEQSRLDAVCVCRSVALAVPPLCPPRVVVPAFPRSPRGRCESQCCAAVRWSSDAEHSGEECLTRQEATAATSHIASRSHTRTTPHSREKLDWLWTADSTAEQSTEHLLQPPPRAQQRLLLRGSRVIIASTSAVGNRNHDRRCFGSSLHTAASTDSDDRTTASDTDEQQRCSHAQGQTMLIPSDRGAKTRRTPCLSAPPCTERRMTPG